MTIESSPRGEVGIHIDMADVQLDKLALPQVQAEKKAPTVLDQYRNGDIDGVARSRPDFEMKYPLSEGEIESFQFFERYMGNHLIPEDEGLLEAIGDDTSVLDQERAHPGHTDDKGRRPTLLGYKLGRYDRYKVEKQLREEQEKQQEVVEPTQSTDLPKAA